MKNDKTSIGHQYRFMYITLQINQVVIMGYHISSESRKNAKGKNQKKRKTPLDDNLK